MKHHKEALVFYSFPTNPVCLIKSAAHIDDTVSIKDKLYKITALAASEPPFYYMAVVEEIGTI